MSDIEQHDLPPVVVATLSALIGCYQVERGRCAEALRREAESRRLLSAEQRELRKAKKRIRDLEIEKKRAHR